MDFLPNVPKPQPESKTVWRSGIERMPIWRETALELFKASRIRRGAKA